MSKLFYLALKITFLLLVLPIAMKGQLPDNYPPTYICYQTKKHVKIDGDISGKPWSDAPWSEYFTDLKTGAAVAKKARTRFKMLWDKNYLYLAGELEETNIEAKMTERESKLYLENAFEFFLDPDGDNYNYLELEINALNTIWDLKLDKPYRDGGKANSTWNIEGLKTAVRLCGSLNDSRKDKKWYVEAAFPWEVLQEMALYKSKPWNGALWKMNLLRTDWKHTVGEEPVCAFHAWQPAGDINIHQPEKWGYLQFCKDIVGESAVEIIPDLDFELKMALMEIYEKQKRHFSKTKKYFYSFDEMKNNSGYIPAFEKLIKIKKTKSGFEARVNGMKAIFSISENGQLKRMDYM